MPVLHKFSKNFTYNFFIVLNILQPFKHFIEYFTYIEPFSILHKNINCFGWLISNSSFQKGFKMCIQQRNKWFAA